MRWAGQINPLGLEDLAGSKCCPGTVVCSRAVLAGFSPIFQQRHCSGAQGNRAVVQRSTLVQERAEQLENGNACLVAQAGRIRRCGDCPNDVKPAGLVLLLSRFWSVLHGSVPAGRQREYIVLRAASAQDGQK